MTPSCPQIVRTTVDLDDDILLAAKSLAALQGRSLGKTLSDLLRSAQPPPADAQRDPTTARRGGLQLDHPRSDPHHFVPKRIHSHNQLTDVYLLGLCKHHGGKLATFGRRISTDAIVEGDDLIEFL